MGARMGHSGHAPLTTVGTRTTLHAVSPGERVRQFLASVPKALGPILASALPEGVRVGFDVRGERGGRWTVRVRGGALTVTPGLDEPLDCVLRGESDVFAQLIDGRREARALFLSGALEVEGDVGLLLVIQRAIGARRRMAG